jgi:hypothetical protein
MDTSRLSDEELLNTPYEPSVAEEPVVTEESVVSEEVVTEPVAEVTEPVEEVVAPVVLPDEEFQKNQNQSLKILRR